MILDASLVFSDAQAVTVTAASTNNIDTLAAGQAYVGILVVFLVTTTFTAAGAATMTIDIETDGDSAFGSPTVLMNLATTVAVASLVAGTSPYRIVKRFPPTGAERYIRGKYTVASGPMTAGAADLFFTKDADILISG